MSSTPDSEAHNSASNTPMSVEERLAALEARVEVLESAAPASGEQSTFWVIETLQQQNEENTSGSVIFGGDVDVAGGHFAYQWHRPTKVLTSDEIWTAGFERLSALAHPIRGVILRRLMQSPAQVADFIEEELITSQSTTYHHLSALTSAGWIQKSGGGTYEITPQRVVPLLTIIAASENH